MSYYLIINAFYSKADDNQYPSTFSVSLVNVCVYMEFKQMTVKSGLQARGPCP